MYHLQKANFAIFEYFYNKLKCRKKRMHLQEVTTSKYGKLSIHHDRSFQEHMP